MRGRLFQCLEQCVESIAREHVHLVNDIYLKARRDRRITHRLDNFAHIIDARVRGRVHLDHVHMPSSGNRRAWLALTAWADRWAALAIRADAIERLGNQPRGRGFADPAHACHQEGMGQPVTLDRIGQRAHHRFLTDQLGKGLRAIFARKNAVRLRGSLLPATCCRRLNMLFLGGLFRRAAKHRVLPRRFQLGSAGLVFNRFLSCVIGAIRIVHCQPM